jgi:hypothetical protein
MNEHEITRKLGHVEKELATHSQVLSANAESMKHLSLRSDERLDYIKERFDRLEILTQLNREEAEAARKRMVGAASAAFMAFCTAVWFVVVEPVYEELAILERRLLDVEERTIVLHHHDEPE